MHRKIQNDYAITFEAFIKWEKKRRKQTIRLVPGFGEQQWHYRFWTIPNWFCLCSFSSVFVPFVFSFDFFEWALKLKPNRRNGSSNGQINFFHIIISVYNISLCTWDISIYYLVKNLNKIRKKKLFHLIIIMRHIRHETRATIEMVQTDLCNDQCSVFFSIVFQYLKINIWSCDWWLVAGKPFWHVTCKIDSKFLQQRQNDVC